MSTKTVKLPGYATSPDPQEEYDDCLLWASEEADGPPSFEKLRHHDKQQQYLRDPHRFVVAVAGRRSGKTEIAIRRGIIKALKTPYEDARVIFAAPTVGQAKRIFWNRMLRLLPEEFKERDPSLTELAVELVNGCRIVVTGMDVPERVEGTPITHICLDEYGNMKSSVWEEHVRPALSDHAGSADFIGVPEGRNHYYDLWTNASSKEDWNRFHWVSADILPPAEIAAAQRDLDPITYSQEYGGEFVSFQGRIYYVWDEQNHKPSDYNPSEDLIFCLDFNVAPGVAAIIQERSYGTQVVDEIYIPNHSNTSIVCDQFIARYGDHRKAVRVHGDATGGHRGTAKLDGSDWDIVERRLRNKFDLRMEVPRSNPPVRKRVNAMNSRICSTAGDRRFFVDPKCVNIIKDFEGVRVLNGTDGEIDKKTDPRLTHLSDAIGYYVAEKFPINKHRTEVVCY